MIETATIERIFGGITYLLGAFSKADLFSRLEAFLEELYGPVRFSVLSGRKAAGLRLEFSNHPEWPAGRGESPVVNSLELSRLLEEERDGDTISDIPPSLKINMGDYSLPAVWIRMIQAGGRCYGLFVFHEIPEFRLGNEISGLEDFAFDHISFAYHRVDDHEEVQKELDLCEAKLSAINAIGELLTSLDLEVLLSKLMELSLFLVSAQVGSVVFRGEKGIESRVEWGLSLEVLERLRFRDGPSILERVFETGEPQLIQNFQDAERFDDVPDLQVESYLCIPLVTKNKILGAINLINSASVQGFRREDQESILTLSGLAATAIENAILHKISLEKERITENLRIAQSIQQGMYPKECPQVPGYQMAWITLSCDETGGDYCDFIPMDGENLALAIGDVTGHGIGSALLMATGRASLRALLSVKKGIKEVAEALDAILEEDMDVERFMTLFLGVLDHRRHVLTFLNAGHDKPILYRKKDGSLEELPSTGTPIGILGKDAQHVEGSPRAIGVGDVLLLTTDGVWEEVNPSKERFGRKRLREVLSRVALNTAREIVEAIQKEVFLFTRGAERKDDFTMVAIKRVE